MQAEFPGVPIGFHHLRFSDHLVVFSVIDPVLSNEGLEVRPELHAVGWIEIDHLNLATHPLVFEERVHHLQRVAKDQTVGPWALVFVGVQPVGEVEVQIAEQVQSLPARLMRFKRLEDRRCRMPFMHEQGQRRHADLLPFRLARPVQERLRQAAQSRRALRQRREPFLCPLPDLRLGKDRGLSLLGRICHQVQQPFGKRPLTILVPCQFRREAGIVAIGLRRLAVRELRLDPDIRAQNSLVRMRIGGGPASGCDGRCLGLGGRDCLRTIKTRPRYRSTLTAPLGKNTFCDQLVPNCVIVLVRQIRQVFAKQGKQGAIANGGAVFGNKGKDKIT